MNIEMEDSGVLCQDLIGRALAFQIGIYGLNWNLRNWLLHEHAESRQVSIAHSWYVSFFLKVHF